ncbi:helix-turn-helix transcriptional regulator [Corynebacterium belfantii]|uniref:helix-turn-helix transcriptional regulator n=2 Tax=Corynebacterium belfantii TaxID=2014537 RepID=UPI0018D2B221|nr:helix-turn-helix transcriptional regulator [Corynebacterium belfantii]MBG9328176.1 helix-turn-helix transcriptional regulator [Corynebacterium belfantii]
MHQRNTWCIHATSCYFWDMDVHDLIRIASEHPSRTAREAGIARSTLNRIATGKTQPSLETLQEIALTLGFDIELHVTTAADPGAAQAARFLLDNHVTDASEEWLNRFQRWGLRGREIIRRAGELSNPAGQSGAQFFGWAESVNIPLVSAAAAAGAGTQWALSGVSAENFWLGTSAPGPSILWTTAPEKCGELLERTLPRCHKLEPSGVAVVNAQGTELVDRAQDRQVFYAAPIQTALDLYGLGLEPTGLTEGWFDD